MRTHTQIDPSCSSGNNPEGGTAESALLRRPAERKSAFGLHLSAVIILQSAFSGAIMRKVAPNAGFSTVFLRVRKTADSVAEGSGIRTSSAVLDLWSYSLS